MVHFDARRKRPGLSLIELMLVVVIVGVIASLIIYRLSLSTDTARTRTCRHHCASLNSTIERYQLNTGSYPLSVNDLEGNDYFPDGVPTCPVSGATYTIDGTTHRIQGHLSTTVPGDH